MSWGSHILLCNNTEVVGSTYYLLRKVKKSFAHIKLIMAD